MLRYLLSILYIKYHRGVESYPVPYHSLQQFPADSTNEAVPAAVWHCIEQFKIAFHFFIKGKLGNLFSLQGYNTTFYL